MRVTTSGIVFLIAGVNLCIAAYRFQLPALLPVGILLVFLTVFSLIFALVTSTRMKVKLRAFAPHVSGYPLTYVGTDTDVRVSVTNALPFRSGSFYLEVEPENGFGFPQGVQVPSVAGGGTVEVDATFTPSARGLRGISAVTVAVNGPFRLTMFKKKVSQGLKIAVAPPRVQLASPGLSGRPNPLAETERLSRGTSTRDFYTREYAPGDDLRHIHWKTVARTGQLVVRQEADEDNPVAAVIVHGEGISHPVEFDLLVTAAMSAVHALTQSGFSVRVVMGEHSVQAEPRERNLSVDVLAARAHAAPARMPSAREMRALSELVVCAPDPDHVPRITGGQRVRTHRWYASDIDSETVDDMNFTGMFGGDVNLPSQWSLRGVSCA